MTTSKQDVIIMTSTKNTLFMFIDQIDESIIFTIIYNIKSKNKSLLANRLMEHQKIKKYIFKYVHILAEHHIQR